MLADEFKPNGGTTNFVILLLLEATEGACVAYGPETTIKGQVAAEVNETDGTLTFPNPELKGNSLSAFGKAAKLFGSDEQEYSNGNIVQAN